MEEKKRIFIAIHYMEIGGAERSLLGLLNAFDTSHYEVDLFLYSHRGEFMPLIPEKIHLLPEIATYASLEKPIVQILKEGHWLIAGARLWAKWKCAHYRKHHPVKNDASIFQYVANTTTRFLPSLRKYGEYDLAISFLTPHNIVLKKVNAKKKIAWIHTDYSYIQVNTAIELPVWSGYDYIASISEAVTESFLRVFPSLKNKIVLIENILSPSFIRQQADMENVSKEMEVPANAIKFCSVGRFTDAKNFDNVPWILKEIRTQGIDAYWFIVGYGGDEALIRNQIQKADMGKYVILLGKKTNPYPYIKNCDFYIQPSRYEGKAVTVREAQILHKPVIITNFATSRSQLKDGIDGAIVPLDISGCAKALINIVLNKEKQAQWIQNMQLFNYGNESEVYKLYKLI